MDEAESAFKRPRKKEAKPKAPKYKVLRGLSLDGPVYDEKKARFEVGDVDELRMVHYDMIRQLIVKGVIEEV